MATNNFRQSREPKEFDEKVIQISRVSKKTKGGNKIGFSALVVVGDHKGKVGVALGKASDVLSAIQKGIKKAKKKMIVLPMDGTTIPFAITVKRGAGKIMLKPASKGTGVVAGGPVRAVVEAAGVRDIVGKVMGSDNQSSSVYATFEALNKIGQIVKIKGLKLRSIAEIEEEERKKMAALQAEAKEKAVEKKSAQQSTQKETAKKTQTAKTKVSKKPVQKTAKVASKKPAVKKKTTTGKKTTASKQSPTSKASAKTKKTK